MSSGGRIGVFGGTFDPPHIGHLAVAVEVRHALALDRVLMVVANDPWQKRGARVLTPAADRLEMVRAAAQDLDGVEADDREIRRGGPSYTVDTVEELLGEQPGAELFVVVGADAAAGLTHVGAGRRARQAGHGGGRASARFRPFGRSRPVSPASRWRCPPSTCRARTSGPGWPRAGPSTCWCRRLLSPG